MAITKTQILETLKNGKAPEGVEESLFGFWCEVLLLFVTFDDAKAIDGLLKSDASVAKAEDWGETLALTDEAILAETKHYMEFAWDKVQDHRGISANRSVEKISTLAWLLGRKDVLDAMSAAEYAQYGAPKLKVACEMLGLPMPDDEGTLRMARGEPCVRDCVQGCGS